MNYEVSIPLGIIIAIVLTIVLYKKVMPKKLDGTFSEPFQQRLHDYFHFKRLYLEDVMKFLFAFATVACVVCGALLLISQNPHGYYSKYSGWHAESTFGYGLALLLGGPISLRLAYEGIMLFILLVKNTIDINNKLQACDNESE